MWLAYLTNGIYMNYKKYIKQTNKIEHSRVGLLVFTICCQSPPVLVSKPMRILNNILLVGIVITLIFLIVYIQYKNVDTIVIHYLFYC